MRKYLFPIFMIVLLLACVASARQMVPYAFPFIGRWQPSADPLLIDEYGFQDIQNMRKFEKGLRGVLGHSKITTAPNAFTQPKSGFHFRKGKPEESHVLVQFANAGSTASGLYDLTTAIPGLGTFSSIHSDTTYSTQGRLSSWPGGQVAYGNNDNVYLWGGSETPVSGFLTSTASFTSTGTTGTIQDHLENVQNDDQTKYAPIGGGNDSSTVLLLHCDGVDNGVTITDSSTTPHVVTAHGSLITETSQFKYGNASLYNSGIAGNYASLPDSADFDFDSGNFTIDFWVRFSTLAGEGNRGIYQQFADDDNNIRLYYNATTKLFIFTSMLGGAIQQEMEFSAASLVDDTWYHVAFIRGWGGGANSWAMTLDGTQIGTTQTDADDMPNIAADVDISMITELIGAGDSEFAGWIDEFRVSKGVARWTEDFTPTRYKYLTEQNYFAVGATRPIEGVKFYVADPNYDSAPSFEFVKEWTGSNWDILTVTDNTTGLSTTGTITWTDTGNSRHRFLYTNDLYWYVFKLTSGSASIYYATVDYVFHEPSNVWGGDYDTLISGKVYNGTTQAYDDYTLELQDTEDDTTVAVLDSLATGSEYLYLGFLFPQQGFDVGIPAEKGNGDAATLTVRYWDGEEWILVNGLIDDTASGTDSLAHTGTISFQPPSYSEIKKTSLAGENPIYWYKLAWSANLDAEVDIYAINGIPASDELPQFKFGVMFQGRGFLFNEVERYPNRGIYSAFQTADVFNGDDSSELYFGGNEGIVAAAPIYNFYRTAGYEQLLVLKENETYKLEGDGPTSWVSHSLSSSVGCIAPLSLVVCDSTEVEEGLRRQVAIWQASHGVVMCDGATVDLISDDVSNYWDPTATEYIPVTRQDDSVGFFDPDLQSYKLLITSGAQESTHNVELEFSLKNKEWTKIYRENGSGANPLQVGFQVADTAGKSYTYGATQEGELYRLENTYAWNGTAIAQYVQTKDMMLDTQLPSLRSTVIEFFRLFFKDRVNSNNITISHYGDQNPVATVDGVSNQDVPDVVDMDEGPIYTTSCNLGPFKTHSIKLLATTSNEYYGMSLNGMAFYLTSLDTIQP